MQLVPLAATSWIDTASQSRYLCVRRGPSSLGSFVIVAYGSEHRPRTSWRLDLAARTFVGRTSLCGFAKVWITQLLSRGSLWSNSRCSQRRSPSVEVSLGSYRPPCTSL